MAVSDYMHPILSGALLHVQYRMAASGLGGSRKPMMAVAFAGDGDSVQGERKLPCASLSHEGGEEESTKLFKDVCSPPVLAAERRFSCLLPRSGEEPLWRWKAGRPR